jgi:hypothetical protein
VYIKHINSSIVVVSFVIFKNIGFEKGNINAEFAGGRGDLVERFGELHWFGGC